jgi:hypothetical protein
MLQEPCFRSIYHGRQPVWLAVHHHAARVLKAMEEAVLWADAHAFVKLRGMWKVMLLLLLP